MNMFRRLFVCSVISLLLSSCSWTDDFGEGDVRTQDLVDSDPGAILRNLPPESIMKGSLLMVGVRMDFGGVERFCLTLSESGPTTGGFIHIRDYPLGQAGYRLDKNVDVWFYNDALYAATDGYDVTYRLTLRAVESATNIKCVGNLGTYAEVDIIGTQQ